VDHFNWLAGRVLGDGYVDDRHVEIYNSSNPILKEVLLALREAGVPAERIKIDVYSTDPKVLHVIATSLGFPLANFRLKRDLSPWKANKQKLRVRVSSKHRVPEALNFHYVLAADIQP